MFAVGSALTGFLAVSRSCVPGLFVCLFVTLCRPPCPTAQAYVVLYLARYPQVRDVLVVETGLKSFTIVDVEYGIEKQVYVDKHGAEGCVEKKCTAWVGGFGGGDGRGGVGMVVGL